MNIFKINLKENCWHIILQLLTCMIFVWFVLLSLDYVTPLPLLWAVGASSLASSAYTVFAIPHSHVGSPRRIIGGYFIGILVGVLLHALYLYLMGDHLSDSDWLRHMHTAWMAGGITVGVSMILMVLLDMEHPPAAGVSLVMALEVRHETTLLVIFMLALLLAGIRWVFRRQLINLS